MIEDRSHLLTERANPRTTDIDTLDAQLKIVNIGLMPALVVLYVAVTAYLLGARGMGVEGAIAGYAVAGAGSLATLTILTFLASWNSFLWPLVVATSQDMFTLPVAID